jgi:hypothetical protein
MKFAYLVVQKLICGHDGDFLGVKRAFNIELSGLSPLLD